LGIRLLPVWVVIQHVPYDATGGLAAALERAAIEPVHVRPYLGDALPGVEDLTGLVVLGGPEGAADDEEPEHLGRERELLARAVAMGLPVLGICFGAQLLAVALGGGVTRDLEPEVGMSVVRLTREGQEDGVLGSLTHEFPVLQWHYHSYSPPAGAVRLASSDGCIEQAFRIGENVYGLQFHAEINGELADVVADQLPSGPLDRSAVEVASRSGAALLDRFLVLPRARRTRAAVSTKRSGSP
jgi:GMP synthase-like glutamine amidotransferase